MENLKLFKVVVADKAKEAFGEIIADIADDSLHNART